MSLRDAKAGDTLLLSNGLYSPTLLEVERTTKTRVFTTTGGVYDRRGHSFPHQRWDTNHVRIATPEDIAEVHEETRRHQCIKAILAKCENVNILRKMATAKLVRLVAVLEEKEAE